MSRAIIYARVSTSRQAEEGLPVESQIERCRERAASLGAEVVRVFRDDGISGRTTQRPAFREALDYCDKGKVDYFICWSTSRFARNRLDAALNKRLLEKMGVKLAYASQDFGESDDAWLTEAITEIIDEQYSRSISKDTRRSMVKNARDGFFNGGPVPFGYRASPVGKRRRLDIEPTEAATVRAIFRWYLGGEGCKAIAVRLNDAGSSKRGKTWTKIRVSAVLNSYAVAGRVVFNDAGETIDTKGHEAIISDEDFEKVQSTMRSRAPKNSGGRHRSGAVFSGIVRCGECGEAMVTETAKGRSGEIYRYYNCRTFLQGAGCSNRRRRVDEIDPALLSGILDVVFTPENMRWIAQDLIEQGSQDTKAYQEKIDALGAEFSDVERRLRRLYESIEAGVGLSLPDVAPRIRELQGRQKDIQASIDKLAENRPSAPTVTVVEAMRAANYFKEIVETCESPAKIREFLGHIVKKASIYEREAIVEYWPERLVAASGGSQCVVSWLPDLASLRTISVRLWIPARRGPKAA